MTLIKEEALDALIKNYCRESGVRNLLKHIEKVNHLTSSYDIRIMNTSRVLFFLKLCNRQLEIVCFDVFYLLLTYPFRFTARRRTRSCRETVTLSTFVSKKTICTTSLESPCTRQIACMTSHRRASSWVWRGLPWVSEHRRIRFRSVTAIVFPPGGSVLYIECCARRRHDVKENAEASVELTGRLGDVMKESARIARTLARTFLAEKDPDNKFFDGAHLHIHVPEVKLAFLSRDQVSYDLIKVFRSVMMKLISSQSIS